jgi:hypothetical protein
MHPDYKKSSRMQRPNENTGVYTLNAFACCCCCCWFHLNGYRGSADQTHAALIIMCVCCVSVCIHARPFCSHYAGNPITTQSSKGGDVDECRGAHTWHRQTAERTLFLSWPFFALIFDYFLEHPGKENIQLDLRAFLGISFVGLRKGDVRVNGVNCYIQSHWWIKILKI